MVTARDLEEPLEDLKEELKSFTNQTEFPRNTTPDFIGGTWAEQVLDGGNDYLFDELLEFKQCFPGNVGISQAFDDLINSIQHNNQQNILDNLEKLVKKLQSLDTGYFQKANPNTKQFNELQNLKKELNNSNHPAIDNKSRERDIEFGKEANLDAINKELDNPLPEKYRPQKYGRFQRPTQKQIKHKIVLLAKGEGENEGPQLITIGNNNEVRVLAAEDSNAKKNVVIGLFNSTNSEEHTASDHAKEELKDVSNLYNLVI